MVEDEAGCAVLVLIFLSHVILAPSLFWEVRSAFHAISATMATGKNGAAKGSVLTTANLLTCLRLILTFPFLYLVGLGRLDFALAVFFFAAFTDFADGYVARRFNQHSTAGRLLDPLADKVLTASAFVVMAVPHQEFPSIPVWLAATVVGRDVVILTGALAVYLRTRFRDFKPTLAGKITTAAELGVITAFLLFHVLGEFVFLLPFFYAITLVCVIVSGTEYVILGFGIARRAPRPTP